MADEEFVLRVSSPMTLQNLCIERIARMALRFKANTDKAEVRLPTTYEENHFVCIPSSIIEDILLPVAYNAISYVRNCNSFSWMNVFRVLLVKPIERFEFVFFESSLRDLHGALENSLRHTTSQLKVLKLTAKSYRGYLAPISRTLIMAMSSLMHLEMNYFRCDEATLETIGECCPHLTFLSLRVDQYSSAGLKSLCMNADGTVKRCQNLRTLKLQGGISMDGISALLLGLPKLAVLECPLWAMASAFERLLRNNRQGQPIQLKIRVIEYTDYFLEMCSLVALAQMCPHLEVLTLRLEHSESAIETLQRCPVMANLRKVTFDIWNWDKSAFDNGVVPFLKRNGKFLKVLRLESALYVDYTTFDHLCPNLNKLTFECVHSLDGIISRTGLFTNLDTLRLYELESETDVIQLLSYIRNVRHLKVHCRWLEKEHIQAIISSKAFDHLVTIDIESDYLCIQGEASDSGTPLADILRTTL